MTPRRNADPEVGERIRARRLLRGWSIRYAASRAGVSHATWSRIERGRQAADNRFMLADIAGALECAPPIWPAPACRPPTGPPRRPGRACWACAGP
ncbi:helix-turn-helix domain-containing protein [Paractinoplanes durhamensis]|uniref:helix-turn-helix domain-containing protein n=1 Tax=Paractinoplanes durhamensis TaxID=113563 RepID=UPI0036338613